MWEGDCTTQGHSKGVWLSVMGSDLHFLKGCPDFHVGEGLKRRSGKERPRRGQRPWSGGWMGHRMQNNSGWNWKVCEWSSAPGGRGSPRNGQGLGCWETIITTEQLLKGAAHRKATSTFPAQHFSWEGGMHRRQVSLPALHLGFLLFLQLDELLSGFYLFVAVGIQGWGKQMTFHKTQFLLLSRAICHHRGWLPGPPESRSESSRSSGLGILSLQNLPAGPGRGLRRVRLPTLKLNPNRSNWLGNRHDLFFQGDPGKPSLQVPCWPLTARPHRENQPTYLYCHGWHLSSLQRAPSSLPSPLPSRPEGISECGPRPGGLESPCLWQG